MVKIGILKQAGNARTQTDIEGEKEIINLAVIGAMHKSKYGDIDETYFKNELEKNDAEVTKSGNKFKVTFPSGRQYTVDQAGNVKEKKVNPNAMEISELNKNASTYFGWDVINYAETLPEELQDTEWQLFYAGALDGETEERIYLISKGYVKNTQLPTVVKKGVEVEGAKPIAVDGSEYKAFLSTYQSNETNINDGVIPQYTGLSDIMTNMHKYNKDYFMRKNYSSTNANMKSVAYMMDTITWSTFSTSTKKYSEWAIGGPSVELLFMAYNKYKGLSNDTAYIADAKSNIGYQISKNGGKNYSDSYDKIIEKDVITDENQIDSPYSVSSLTSQATAYWLASPCSYAQFPWSLLYVSSDGNVGWSMYWNYNCGFRPLVLLDSNYTLEKTKDSNNNDAFKIVEQ